MKVLVTSLDDWCKQDRGRKAEIARRSGVSYMAVWELVVRGKCFEREDKALAVLEAIRSMGYPITLDRVWGPANRGEAGRRKGKK